MTVCKTLYSGSIPLTASSKGAGRGHLPESVTGFSVERESNDAAVTNPCLPRKHPCVRAIRVRRRAGRWGEGELPPGKSRNVGDVAIGDGYYPYSS